MRVYHGSPNRRAPWLCGVVSWLLAATLALGLCLSDPCAANGPTASDETREVPATTNQPGGIGRAGINSGPAPVFGQTPHARRTAPERHPPRRGPRDEDEEESASDPAVEPVGPPQGDTHAPYVVLGYNDLGMHCMNRDFSQLCILPPFNNLHAQVLRRRREPQIVTQNVTVNYRVINNSASANKTNFWDFAPALFGVNLPPNVGLTGNRLQGQMVPTGNNDWVATGIPVTPLTDQFQLNAYPLGEIRVVTNNQTAAITRAVVPVSWEISCNLCHAPGMPDTAVDTDILMKHDLRHQTNLLGNRPVLCAGCHADPALGTAGLPNVPSLSHAMHGSHAARMGPVAGLGNTCYACHPGFQTNCQRDIHFARGIYCVACHGDMVAVANPNRVPWVDEPTCASCHQARQPEFEFEEPGRLFKDSRGHQGVHCAACHGSPHAITPTVTAADNIQAIMHQGFPGTIRKCTVCHSEQPHEPFEHHRG